MSLHKIQLGASPSRSLSSYSRAKTSEGGTSRVGWSDELQRAMGKATEREQQLHDSVGLQM